MTKLQLAGLLFYNGVVEVGITDSSGTTHNGILTKVQREDGSGSSFNVTMHDEQGERCTFHMRTDD